jgi:hypothetical protein
MSFVKNKGKKVLKSFFQEERKEKKKTTTVNEPIDIYCGLAKTMRASMRCNQSCGSTS